MAEYPLRLLLAVAVAAAGWAGLTHLQVFSPRDVRAWRRLAAVRGYATPRSGVERLAARTPLVQRLQSELDLPRLLAIANRTETPLAFVAGAVGIGFATAVGYLLLEALVRQQSGDWLLGLPLTLFVPVWLVASLLCLARLRSSARRRQDQADRALGDMLMLVAILTDDRGLQLEDAVRILSRCVETSALQAIVDQRGFLRLLRRPYGSTVELYRAIADHYGIPMFARLADAAENTHVGFRERDVYTRLAKSVYQQRLAEARMRAARAKTLVTIPIAGMLIPLLILLGAPTISSLAGALR